MLFQLCETHGDWEICVAMLHCDCISYMFILLISSRSGSIRFVLKSRHA